MYSGRQVLCSINCYTIRKHGALLRHLLDVVAGTRVVRELQQRAEK